MNTELEEIYQLLREAAARLEASLDLIEAVDRDTPLTLGHKEYMMGRLELLADAVEAMLPEAANATIERALANLFPTEEPSAGGDGHWRGQVKMGKI